jgi:hypothetical protein
MRRMIAYSGMYEAARTGIGRPGHATAEHQSAACPVRPRRRAMQSMEHAKGGTSTTR